MAHKLLERRELMDNRLREQIMDLLTRSPGSYLGKMGRDLHVPTSTLKYHLNILRSFDMVTTVKKGRCRHYFPRRRRFTDAEKRMFAALEHAPTRRVVELIHQNPGVSQAGLVTATGLSQSTVAWHLGKLEEMMLVTSERRGVKEYHLTTEFREVLERLARDPDDGRTEPPQPAGATDGPAPDERAAHDGAYGAAEPLADDCDDLRAEAPPAPIA